MTINLFEYKKAFQIPIKGTAVTNATDIDSDDLASALERELNNAIPVILEELDKKEKGENTVRILYI